MKSTQLAHQLVSDWLEGGDVVIDATAGNGHVVMVVAAADSGCAAARPTEDNGCNP